MTFTDKLKFWKKDKDDSGFETGLPPMDDSFGSPPGNDPLTGSSSFDDSSFGTSGQQPGTEPFSSPDISQPQFGSPAQSQQYPQDSFSDRPDPLTNPSQVSSPSTFGQQLAQDYIAKEQSPPQQQAPPAKNDDRELVQLKLDAIRSELNAMSQRMIKIEHLLEKKQRGW